MVGQVVLEDVGVEAVALLKLVVRGVGEHDQDAEAEHEVLERVEAELGHGGGEARREKGGERGGAA